MSSEYVVQGSRWRAPAEELRSEVKCRESREEQPKVIALRNLDVDDDNKKIAFAKRKYLIQFNYNFPVQRNTSNWSTHIRARRKTNFQSRDSRN